MRELFSFNFSVLFIGATKVYPYHYLLPTEIRTDGKKYHFHRYPKERFIKKVTSLEHGDQILQDQNFLNCNGSVDKGWFFLNEKVVENRLIPCFVFKKYSLI